MAKINVSINKKIYSLFCQDGDEKRIELAAEAFDKKLNELRKASPSTSSEMLMVICILETQDKLSEALKNLNQNDNNKKQVSSEIVEKIDNIDLYIQKLTTKIQDASIK